MSNTENTGVLDETMHAQIQQIVEKCLIKLNTQRNEVFNDPYETSLRQRVIRLEERTEELKDIMIEQRERMIKSEEKFTYLIQMIEQRFDGVDKRFEDLIKSIDKRFDAVDKRFEDLIKSIDKRFDAVDKRFEDLIKSIDKRFDAVDKRFEVVDKRFDDMNKRFDDMHKQFDRLIRTLKWLFAFGISIIAVLMTIYKFLDRFL